ncbi:DNA repair protein endonuclease SAE2/CtIP C-terminus-domain-containing protein [Rhexocercosporidium sp. MPI-PUGE-AT-0058]|nr:DNA repair protein endonuclease SAE2/CtIP C-terminus-domain-containing protein [Rhexocercosporidium sp. MPI-PUGE-AT-0058]
MESWKQGRSDLFEQLENVYNQIGANIASELNNDKFARISKEELRILRETSASVQKLAESHGRLTDELEVCREAAAKVEELEKENKRLAQELQTRLERESTPPGKPASRVQYGTHLDLTPGSSEPPSSVARLEPGETKQATQKKYDDLVKKYNKVCQKLDAMKGAKEMAANLVKEERIKSQNWSDWGKNMGEKVAKKDEKIRKLKEEIDSLKLRLGDRGDKLEEEHMSDQQPETVQGTRNVLLPMSDIVDAQVQVPASSPPKGLHQGLAKETSKSNAGQLGVNEGHGQPNEPETKLPALRDEETCVGDTSFDPLCAHHTSSTEDDPDLILPEQMTGKDIMASPEAQAEEPCSLPIFISSRSVKKRKTREHNTDETPGPKIKREVIELSSPHTPVLGCIDATESMDLDDIGDKVSTPRKAHKVALGSQHISQILANSQLSSQNRSRSRAQSNISTTSVPISQVTPVRSETSVLQPRSINTNILPRTSDDTGRTSKKRKVASDRAVAELVEDGEITPVKRELKGQTSNNERLIELLTKPSPGKSVLSPPQNRPAIRPSTSILTAIQKPASKILSTSTVALAQELLESALRKQSGPSKTDTVTENPSRDPTPISRASSTRASREPAESTILPPKRAAPGLLESTRPSSGPVLRSSAESFRPFSKTPSRGSKEPSLPDEEGSGRSPSPFPGTQLPARRDLASAFISRTIHEVTKASPRTPTIARPGRPATVKQKQTRTEGDYVMDPSQEPLRARPVSKLSLRDFKINPLYNQGYNFAFNEVVRGKEARACLEGCIKPECCGHKFRGLAKAELDNRRPTLSQGERDEALLEDYLGSDADRIKYMSSAEREETLIQAKTREIANKHGRHRHAYERGASPTGFWRTDFPTTQEEIEDREAEREREREMVQQRYRHAMRPGGAYLFRDE